MGQPQIARKEWLDKDTFMSHTAKIVKARNVFEQDIIDSMRKEFLGLRGIKPARAGYT